ncbi:transposase [Amycolatopsis sp. NPDC059657]|uniref:transposase n=1 Tax=Amycolatopsis sp. NPDC059657 TaxID=3346899 RepID=UPI00367309FE
MFEKIRDRLREKIRLRANRNPAPSAAVIDSQSVKAAETVGKPSRGYDGGKKIDGRKRHIATDTQGLLLLVLVTAANLQDRSAARKLLPALHAVQRGVTWVWADGGYTSKDLCQLGRHPASSRIGNPSRYGDRPTHPASDTPGSSGRFRWTEPMRHLKSQLSHEPQR